MIRYGLRCHRGHEFEAWFRSADDYDRALAADESQCPQCGSHEVEKALMTPAVGGTAKTVTVRPESPTLKLASGDPRQKSMRAALKELRKKVIENADYVGERFTEEARKIHYEEVEPRGIYGEATAEDARAMTEEGIEFHPLPRLPEDVN